MIISIDTKSGFCFGVRRAINMGENEARQNAVYALGEMVHNQSEVKRLEQLGIQTISQSEFKEKHGTKIIFRAHGEPPESYENARNNQLEVVDGTCPIVAKLQEKIREIAEQNSTCQLVICGKKNHPEVVGLVGHSGAKARVAESEDELAELDFNRPIWLFAQTTLNKDVYSHYQEYIRNKFIEKGNNPGQFLRVNQSICNQVSGRIPAIRQFAASNQLLVFVGGSNSSNARTLFANCLEVNLNSRFIGTEAELKHEWFDGIERVGITGATSTPLWQLERVKNEILKLARS